MQFIIYIIITLCNIIFNLRETCLLIDPKDSSAAAKQYVALIVGECKTTDFCEGAATLF